jgi:AcrR family transcriptional regulator
VVEQSTASPGSRLDAGSSSVPARALRAAREILEETGDEQQVSMRGIARRIGVAAPSLYEHFPNVEALRRRASHEATEAFFVATTAPIREEHPTRETVREFGRLYLLFAREHPQVYRQLFTRLSPVGHREVGDEAQVLFDSLVMLVEKVLGDTARHPAARERMLFAWLELHGIATLPAAHPGYTWPEDAELLDKVVDRLFDA